MSSEPTMSSSNLSATRPGPLAGVTVLDLGTLVAGPVAATLLGDFGATVIKVEQPQGGDTLRHLGPFSKGESLWWNIEGRNKESIAIDLRLPEGRDLIRKLVARADVIIENFRPGTMAKWDLDYAHLKQINPRLVMLSVSGYGQTGPYASRAGYDRVAMAFSGLMYITGFPDRPPLRNGTTVADYQTALFGAFAVMMALFARERHDNAEGQHIDLSIYESVFRFSESLVTACAMLGEVRQRMGNKFSAAAPGEHFETCDGRYLVLAVASDSVFRRLCLALERPDLATDERYKDHKSRWANIDAINQIVAEWIKSHPVAFLVEVLEKHGLAFSLIYTAEDILADPHYAARGSIATVESPRLGPIKMPGVVPKMSGTPSPSIRLAPQLGQDTAAVLRRVLDMDEESIAQLTAKGVVGAAVPTV